MIEAAKAGDPLGVVLGAFSMVPAFALNAGLSKASSISKVIPWIKGAIGDVTRYAGSGGAKYGREGVQAVKEGASSLGNWIYMNSIKHPDVWDTMIRTMTTGYTSMKISELMSEFLPKPPPFGPPTLPIPNR